MNTPWATRSTVTLRCTEPSAIPPYLARQRDSRPSGQAEALYATSRRQTSVGARGDDTWPFLVRRCPVSRKCGSLHQGHPNLPSLRPYRARGNDAIKAAPQIGNAWHCVGGLVARTLAV